MRRFITVFALVGLIAFVPGLAEAKMGDLFRGGAGSRGSRTFSAPPPTNTAPSPAAPIQRTITPPRPTMAAFAGGAGFGAGAAPQRPKPEPLQLSAADFPAFERLLAETQDAYGREDVAALSRLATPEMVRYFNVELGQRRQKGLVNRISGVKLLQGDLAEAWQEGRDEYATVAMRFALIDVTQERATDRVVSGGTHIFAHFDPDSARPRAFSRMGARACF